jgi:EAL domain-containing protein (putative c-di-GMP-specific phosphodiesterase class I)
VKRCSAALKWPYQAKSQGRNVSCFFDPQLQSALQERRTLEQDMRAGLQAGEFELFYQPQVEMGKVIGAEGCCAGSILKKASSPAHFIPLAEETGVILPLGDWVLQAACQQLAKWAKHPAMRNWCSRSTSVPSSSIRADLSNRCSRRWPSMGPMRVGSSWS